MKTVSWIVGLTLAVLAAPLSAQMAVGVIADIPFEFVVANEVLPPGQYLVRSQNSAEGTTLVVTEADKGGGVFVFSNRTARNDDDTWNKTALMFRRYGKTHFLAEVTIAGYDTGRYIRPCRREREMVDSKVKYAKVWVMATVQ